MDKEKKKFLQRRIGWIFTRLLTSFSGSISLELNYKLGRLLGQIAYLAVRRHRRISLESLKIAFPDMPAWQRKKISRDFFIFMAQGSFELLHILKNPRQLANIRVEGKEYLDQALKAKQGVILLTAHIGNFPLMSLKLAKQGYNVHFVTRPMRDEKASDYIHKLRTAAGVKTIFSYPRRECVNAIIRALADNQIVIMQMDQNFGTGGLWVKFFGKLAATPTGPVVLALRTKAAVVPAYIFREKTGFHCINILPEEKLILTQDKEETILLNTIKFTRLIESRIRLKPCQWGWIHRRWKSQPSEKIKALKFKIEQ